MVPKIWFHRNSVYLFLKTFSRTRGSLSALVERSVRSVWLMIGWSFQAWRCPRPEQLLPRVSVLTLPRKLPGEQSAAPVGLCEGGGTANVTKDRHTDMVCKSARAPRVTRCEQHLVADVKTWMNEKSKLYIYSPQRRYTWLNECKLCQMQILEYFSPDGCPLITNT